MIELIEANNLVKRYGKHTALNGLNFTVEKGEILGLLGVNGAGKSTTMNIMTGYISATEGTVKIDGIDILEEPEKVKKKIGYLPEIPPLYMDMTVKEYLMFVSKIKKVKSKDAAKNIESVMELIKIGDVQNRLIKNLSKGYKQRVGLAQAIIGDPEVLILDEPTVGLDPKQIFEMRNLIKKLGENHTIILSSHILSEVSAVCNRLLIVSKGEIVATGTPEELSRRLNSNNKIILRAKGERQSILKAIKDIPEVYSVKEQGIRESGTLDILVEAKEDIDIREKIFITMSRSEHPILMMKNIDVTLEEIFLQVTTAEKGGLENVSYME